MTTTSFNNVSKIHGGCEAVDDEETEDGHTIPSQQQQQEQHSLLTMIASTLLLRIPIVVDDDDDEDVDDDQVDPRSTTTGSSTGSAATTSKHNIARQLTSWLDHYHHQQQQPPPPPQQQQQNSINIQLTSTECSNDLLYLYECRRNIRTLLHHISQHYRQYHGTMHNISYPSPDDSYNNNHRSNHNHTSSSQNQQQQHTNSTTTTGTTGISNSTTTSAARKNGVPFIEYVIQELQHYVAILQEFIQRGFPSNDTPDSSVQFVSLTWYCPIQYEENENELYNENDADTGNGKRRYETHHSLAWECVNVLYNIVVLYTYRSSAVLEGMSSSSSSATAVVKTATTSITPTRAQWTKAGQYLQNAATIVRYMRETYYVSNGSCTTTAAIKAEGELLSSSNHSNTNYNNSSIWYSNSLLLVNSTFCEVLQLHLLAEAQRAAYQTFVATSLVQPQATATSSKTDQSANATTSSPHISSSSTTSPPKHFVLAKLAAAAAPLYLAVEDLCQGSNNNHNEEEDDDDDNDTGSDIDNGENHQTEKNEDDLKGIDTLGSNHSGPSLSTESNIPTTPITQQQQWSSTQFIQEWEDSVRAYGMWMTTLAEYHQSWVHRKRNQNNGKDSTTAGNSSTVELGMEIARLECALKFADYCRDFCDSTSVRSVQLLLPQIIQLIREMEERFEIAKHENDQYYHETIPDHDELPEISHVLSVKTDVENISKLLPSLNPERVILFANVLDPNIRTYVEVFRMKVQNVIVQTEQLANRQTEMARAQLAAVNLPHSLTTYRQQQNGGGLPDDIWDRIVLMQKQNIMDQFTREVWSIRERSNTAQTTMQQIHAQLTDVLEIDTVFRQTNSQFVGHDVQQIQKIFLPIVQTYDQVISSAQDSDDLLLKRCDMFDTDPKFRLLKLQKSQLDRLFPPITSADHIPDNAGTSSTMYDTTALRNLLVDLSALFNHRETVIHSLKEHCKTYDISKELSSRGLNASDGTYQETVDMALASLQPLVNEISANLEKQGKLLYKIKAENDIFMKVRNQQAQRRVASIASMQGGPIIKIFDALEQVESFTQHVQQGREFYDVVIPKLQKLQEQVDDVSNRLAKERMEHETLPRRANRRSFTRDNDIGQSSGYNRRSGRFNIRHVDGYNETMGMPYNHDTIIHQQSSRPNVSPSPQPTTADRLLQTPPTSHQHASYGGVSDFVVDDEKVASLVGMDFDPAKVVAALKSHNNDLELALNELLAA